MNASWSGPLNGPVCDTHGKQLHALNTMMPLVYPPATTTTNALSTSWMTLNSAAGNMRGILQKSGTSYPVLVSARKVEVLQPEEHRCLYRWTIPYPTRDSFDGTLCQIASAASSSASEQTQKSSAATPTKKTTEQKNTHGGLICASVNKKQVWMWPTNVINLNNKDQVIKVSMHHPIAAIHAVHESPYLTVIHTNGETSLLDEKGLLLATVIPESYPVTVTDARTPVVLSTAMSSPLVDSDALIVKQIIAVLTTVEDKNGKRKIITLYTVYYNLSGETKTLGKQNDHQPNVIVPAQGCTAVDTGSIMLDSTLGDSNETLGDTSMLVIDDPPCILLSFGGHPIYKLSLRPFAGDTDLANMSFNSWNIGTAKVSDEDFDTTSTRLEHSLSGLALLGPDKILVTGAETAANNVLCFSTMSVRYLATISLVRTSVFTAVTEGAALRCSLYVGQSNNVLVALVNEEIRCTVLDLPEGGSLAAILKSKVRSSLEPSSSSEAPVSGDINAILESLETNREASGGRGRKRQANTGDQLNGNKRSREMDDEGEWGETERELWRKTWKNLTQDQEKIRQTWSSKSPVEVIRHARTLLTQSGETGKKCFNTDLDCTVVDVLVDSMNRFLESGLEKKSKKDKTTMMEVTNSVLVNGYIFGVSKAEKELCSKLTELGDLQVLFNAVTYIGQLSERTLIDYLQWIFSHPQLDSEKTDAITPKNLSLKDVNSNDLAILSVVAAALKKSWNDVELENALRNLDVWYGLRLLTILLFLLRKCFQQSSADFVSKDEEKQFIVRVVEWMQVIVDAHFSSFLLNSSLNKEFLDILERYRDLMKKIESTTYHTCELYGAIQHVVKKAKLPVRPLPEYSVETILL